MEEKGVSIIVTEAQIGNNNAARKKMFCRLLLLLLSPRYTSYFFLRHFISLWFLLQRTSTVKSSFPHHEMRVLLFLQSMSLDHLLVLSRWDIIGPEE